MHHAYEVEFCESIAGGFAAFLKAERPNFSAPGAPNCSYLLIQAESWPTLEQRLRVAVQRTERMMASNPRPIRINFTRVKDWPCSMVACDSWLGILGPVGEPFAPSRPVPGLGPIDLGPEKGVGLKIRLGFSVVLAAAVAEPPKPELIAKLLQAVEDETPESFQLPGDRFPVGKREVLAQIFERIEQALG